jgi:hypothetical protein
MCFTLEIKFIAHLVIYTRTLRYGSYSSLSIKPIKRIFTVRLNFSQSLDIHANMKSVKIFSFFLLAVCTLHAYASQVLSENQVPTEDIDSEAKGILDTKAPTTTVAPGLGGLSGIGQNVANAGPMLIIGGFQAVVTKFDPSLIQGLPGMSGLPPIPGKK